MGVEPSTLFSTLCVIKAFVCADEAEVFEGCEVVYVGMFWVSPGCVTLPHDFAVCGG